MNRESRLWAITAYFDPFNKGHRLPAYREFRRRLAIPLIAVELSSHDQFHLGPDDADIVIHLSGGAVLWQKERLLNVALQALPAHVDAVAWLDCDLVFLRPDWPQALMRRLEANASDISVIHLPARAFLGALPEIVTRPPRPAAQTFDAAAHPLLPPVGNVTHLVALETMLNHFERVFLIEHHVHWIIHIHRAKPRGIEGQQAHFESVRHAVVSRHRPLQDRLAKTGGADDLVRGVRADLNPIAFRINKKEPVRRI